MKNVRQLVPLDEVTATTVSEPTNIRYAKKATFLFERSSHVSGSSIFSIQASVAGKEGGAFVPNVNLISNDPNNHSQTIERQITVELTADGKKLFALDLEHFCYDYIQVKLVASGSGKSTVKLLILE
jgi:hypothetical protein